jgi:hypothetical protein
MYSIFEQEYDVSFILLHIVKIYMGTKSMYCCVIPNSILLEQTLSTPSIFSSHCVVVCTCLHHTWCLNVSIREINNFLSTETNNFSN